MRTYRDQARTYMDKKARLEAYFSRGDSFGDGIRKLRSIALQTPLEESLKWNAPVYCLDGKNILGILAFKNHFGLWFYDGVFMSDPLGVLENAQEGKTRSMRHWKFTDPGQVDPALVKDYLEEAVSIARKGLKLEKRPPQKLRIPEMLKTVLEADPGLKERFDTLTPYKKKDFAEYISSAKQQATKERRLKKILPMIRKGVGLNDPYRKEK